MGPATASAQAKSPELALCLGAAHADGSFQPQEITVPVVGLQLTGCVHLAPDSLSPWLTGVLDGLTNAQPPSGPPSQEDLEAIVEVISNLDPSNPLGALEVALLTCQHTGLMDYCQAALIGVLGAPLPLGNRVDLQGQEGFCWNGSQSGTGSAFGAGNFWNLEWTADYEAGSEIAGVISGTASNFQGEQRTVSGLIGPGCGAGVKGMVLVFE